MLVGGAAELSAMAWTAFDILADNAGEDMTPIEVRYDSKVAAQVALALAEGKAHPLLAALTAAL